MTITGITIEADSVVVSGIDFDALCAAIRENETLRTQLSARLQQIEEFRTALRGITSCSTCEACRGAAVLALQPTPQSEVPK